MIPWFVEGKVWKLSVRRPDKSYFQVLGSSDALYNTDSMQPGMAVMLVESEIDALSVHQEAGDLIASVATGGTSKGQTQRWITAIKQVPGLLIGFDADEAGNAGAANWQKKTEPFQSPALLIGTSKEAVIKRTLDPWIKLNDAGLPEFCSTATCRNRAIAWKSNSEMMQAFCEKHKPARFGW